MPPIRIFNGRKYINWKRSLQNLVIKKFGKCKKHVATNVVV